MSSTAASIQNPPLSHSKTTASKCAAPGPHWCAGRGGRGVLLPDMPSLWHIVCTHPPPAVIILSTWKIYRISIPSRLRLWKFFKYDKNFRDKSGLTIAGRSTIWLLVLCNSGESTREDNYCNEDLNRHLKNSSLYEAGNLLLYSTTYKGVTALLCTHIISRACGAVEEWRRRNKGV